MIVKSVSGNCRASRYSFICLYCCCFFFDMTLSDAFINTTFMILSSSSACLSRVSFSTANAWASESCLGAFPGELKELLGEIMWKTSLSSSTDRVSWKPVLPCPVLSAKTNPSMTSLTIADCLNFLAGCVQLPCGCPEVLVAYIILEHQKTQSSAFSLRTHSTTYVNIAALTYGDRTLFTLKYKN